MTETTKLLITRTMIAEVDSDLFRELVARATTIADDLYEGEQIQWDFVWEKFHGQTLFDGREIDIVHQNAGLLTAIRDEVERY